MREIYEAESEPAGDGKMSLLPTFFISIDWSDPDAKILSSPWNDVPLSDWHDTEVTTKNYGQMQVEEPFLAAQIDEKRKANAQRRSAVRLIE
jgi:hypothetical protein